MAEIRIKVLRLPEGQAERDSVISNLTLTQATAGANAARYWIDPVEKILVLLIPVAE